MIQAPHELVGIADHSDVGAARRVVDSIAGGLGMGLRASGSAQLAATELGTNILRYATKGYLLLRPLNHPPGLEILAVDRGPGIANPAAVLAGAGATTDGLGVGLDSVQRLATTFDLYTAASKGTVVLARFDAEDAPGIPGPSGVFRSGGVSLAVVPGDPNGDGWAATHDDTTCSMLVIDGLGHGPLAHQATQAALAAFETSHNGDPRRWFQHAHAAMRSTRGGVAAFATVNLAERRLLFAGVGNIQGRLVAQGQSHGLVSQPGTMGIDHQIPRLRLVELAWSPGASLVLWSDGLRSDVTLHRDPTLLARHPALMAAVLHRDFARGTDDATVVVVQDRTSN